MLVHAALLTVSVLFGLNFVAIKLVLEELPPAVWALFRIGGATLILAPIAIATNRRRATPRPWPSAATWLRLLPAAFLGFAANQTLFVLGLARTTPGHSSLITTTIPFWTLVIAVLVGQERLRGGKVAGLVLAVGGVLTLLEIDTWIGRGVEIDETLVGDLLTLTNAISFSCFLVLMRKVGRGLDAMQATVICFALATVMIASWAAPQVEARHFAALVQAEVWPLALFAIIGGTVITYLLNNWALQRAESSFVALYIYTQPVLATTTWVVIGRDAPGPRLGVAFALVAGGIVVQTLTGRRARPAAAVSAD